MQAAAKGGTGKIVENQGAGLSGRNGVPRAEDLRMVAFDDATTFDEAGRQSPVPPDSGGAARWLGPLLGGLFITTLVILTLAAAVITGAQEGMMVAGLGRATSTMTPSPVVPSVTPVPSPTPAAPTATLSSPSPTTSPTGTARAAWRATRGR